MTTTLEADLDQMSASVGGVSRLRAEAVGINRYKATDELTHALLNDVPRVTRQFIEVWQDFCAKAVDDIPDGTIRGESTLTPFPGIDIGRERERWAKYGRKAVGLLQQAIDLGESLAKQGREVPACLPAIKRLHKTVSRMVADIERMHTPEDVIAIAVKWPRIDREAFSRNARNFAPTQAMYDDSWD